MTLTTLSSTSDPAQTPPSPAAQQLFAGQDHHAHGRMVEAIAAYSRGIDIARTMVAAAR